MPCVKYMYNSTNIQISSIQQIQWYKEKYIFTTSLLINAIAVQSKRFKNYNNFNNSWIQAKVWKFPSIPFSHSFSSMQKMWGQKTHNRKEHPLYGNEILLSQQLVLDHRYIYGELLLWTRPSGSHYGVKLDSPSCNGDVNIHLVDRGGRSLESILPMSSIPSD